MANAGHIITLTTDFGTRDCYVAAMKGVILAINPDARIVDLTHEIGPQNVLEAAFFLKGSAPHFPEGTVHVVVVDPGVGTDRRALCVEADGRCYVAPDNGVLSLVATPERLVNAVAIENQLYLRPTISATFHGRDVFAPAAAHLSLGVEMSALGAPVHEMMRFELPAPRAENDRTLAGQVVHIDRFGNIITNVDMDAWNGLTRSGKGRDVQIRIHGLVLNRACKAYSEVPQGSPLALWGSSDLLEISVNRGNAAERLGAKVGDLVTIQVGTR
jgi:S-adenosylmethionine hydrolase